MTSSDYRESHQAKGPVYDAQLSESPWDAFLAIREAEILRRVCRQLSSAEPMVHLDFACGTGRALEATRGHAAAQFGIDISESMVAQARRKLPEAEFWVGDVSAGRPMLPVPTLATAFRFLGNAEPHLRSMALEFLRDTLARDGRLVVDNHRNPRTIRNALSGESVESQPGGRVDLTLPLLESLLHEHGFRVLDVQGVGWWVVMARLKRTRILNSRTSRLLEAVGRFRPLAAVSPAMVIVAEPR